MRRKDKEITDKKWIEEILGEAQVLRLAMVDGEEPYLVAMNFAYVDDVLYMHSAKEGRKIDLLKKNHRVAFQTDTGVEQVLNKEACSCGMKYLSVSGTGRAFLVDDKEEKTRALDAMMSKYTGRVRCEYPESMLDKTQVMKVHIESMTGKKSGY